MTITAAPARLREVSLDDKYNLDEGTVFMTGVQALVRLPIEQVRRDRLAGLRTGVMISGYPGSPLGGYDIALSRAKKLLAEHDVKHVPGVNEEVGAATVWGSQMTHLFGKTAFDGVTGIWYGKSPGVDRSLDIFRHANLGGGPTGSAMLALAGDDPSAKSSTITGASEWDLIACGMPILYPASVGEFLSYGLHGIALSRLTGLWTSLKVVTNLCDGGATVNLHRDLPAIALPDLEGFRKPMNFTYLAAAAIELERHMFEERLPAALEYARANQLNEIVLRGPNDRIGLVASGKSYADLRQACTDLGLGEEELERLGVRILKIGMLYPFEPEIVREFADGLEQIIVVEEKRDLIEAEIRNALYSSRHRPVVLGKHDDEGRPLFAYHGELDPDLIAERIGPRIARLGPAPAELDSRLAELASIASRTYDLSAARAPNFCSGCPHSRSVRSLDGDPMGGGIGCSAMGLISSQEERRPVYVAPMGAEGAPWIGCAPWVEQEHIVQNVGDGTFFHSGSQSLRAAVSSGVNITYKILFNGHIAMTGGQSAVGNREVPRLARYLESEGIKRIIVVSDNPEAIAKDDLPANATVYDRTRHDEAMRELRDEPGATVLLYDQECAAEKRRARKRGTQAQPNKYVVINEDVCEGCGDCGAVSNCMSVLPVETDFGRKTQIHQASCNNDYSCLQGDCPSFMTVYSDERPKHAAPPAIEAGSIDEPTRRAGASNGYNVYLAGIGGTGVVTVSQLLAYAALLEGKQVHSLDQTGLAQKGGAVLSTVHIYEGAEQPYISNKVGLGKADLVMGLDTLGLVYPANADRMSPERTVIVADTAVQPTAEAIRHVDFSLPAPAAIRAMVEEISRADENVWVDAARVSGELFNDDALTNVFLMGAAYQSGLLPIGADAFEQAIRLNGVAVEKNLQAFRYGRLYVADPGRIAGAKPVPPSYEQVRTEESAQLNGSASTYQRLLDRGSQLSDPVKLVLARRVGELIRYQNAAYAERYVDKVLAVAAVERAAVPGHDELTEAAARYLYKLMAYKDEYEVARLLLKDKWTERVRREFINPTIKFNLHPPLLRDRGLKNKLELGAWFKPALASLAPAKRLRGTRLDPFGRAEVRQIERALIPWYEGVLDELCARLDGSNYALAVEIASAPDGIRGYESIKLANVTRVRAQVETQLAELRVGAAAPAV